VGLSPRLAESAHDFQRVFVETRLALVRCQNLEDCLLPVQPLCGWHEHAKLAVQLLGTLQRDADADPQPSITDVLRAGALEHEADRAGRFRPLSPRGAAGGKGDVLQLAIPQTTRLSGGFDEAQVGGAEIERVAVSVLGAARVNGRQV
jgi:hypothetical protein